MDIYGSGSIVECCNLKDGSVTGGQDVGGITGGTRASGCNIMNCYNKGEVTSNLGAGGGIAGYCSAIVMKSCFNIGSVSGVDSDVEKIGGIIGSLESEESGITKCYYLEGSAEHACGSDADYSMDEEMKKSETDLKNLVDDLGDAFEKDEGDGYPKLKWE